ncbi:MAG: transposase [Planctomycetaceae bacterium]
MRTRIRQQLLKFLLRQGRRFTEGVSHWTKTHWSWIRRQTFDFEAQNQLLADAIATADQAQSRITRLNADIHDALADRATRLAGAELAGVLRNSGVDGRRNCRRDWRLERFLTAAKFMSFVGLVPSEASSGPTRRQGGITKSGNRHATSADRSSLALLSCPTKREPRTCYSGRRSASGGHRHRRHALRRLVKTLAEVAANQEVHTKIVTAPACELAVPVVRRDHHAASASRTDTSHQRPQNGRSMIVQTATHFQTRTDTTPNRIVTMMF